VQLRLPILNYYARRTVPLSVFVSGYSPTAQVSFSSGGALLGTAPVAGGIATLGYRFIDPGTYQVSASYPGDASNLPSNTDTGTLTIAPGPDFSMAVSPATATVKAGGTVTYTITVTPINGYGGTVSMGCQFQNSSTTCPTALLNVANGQASTMTLSFVTSATGTTQPRISLYRTTAGFALLLFSWTIRRRRLALRWQSSLWTYVLAAGLLTISGCSSPSAANTTPTASATTYNVVVTGADTSIETSHTVTLQMIVN